MSPRKLCGLCAVLVAAALSEAGVFADVVSITGSTSDFEPRLRTGGTIGAAGPYDPGPSTTATTLRIGFQANFQITTVVFFQLPGLAPGQSISSADFSITAVPDSASTATTPGFNADLVAIGYVNSTPPANGTNESQSYYYVGEGSADTAPGHAQIQNNFLTPTDFIPLGGTRALHSTDGVGDAALLTYINGLYAGQATNGFIPGTSSLVLRLNPDITASAGTVRYTVASAEDATSKPTLTLDVTPVPEPGTITLAMLLGLCLVAARWRCR